MDSRLICLSGVFRLAGQAALNWLFLTAKRPDGREQGAVKEPLQAATPRGSGARRPAGQTALNWFFLTAKRPDGRE